MKREELWKVYIKKNPKFIQEDAQITFTTKGLRQFFERTFDSAFNEGAKQSINEESAPNNSIIGDKNFDSIFGEIFGNEKK